MSERTLEEIEALAADATPGPWTTKGKSVKALGAPSERTAPNGWQGGICNCMGSGHGPRSRIDALAETNAALIAELPNLLAIAQEQRGAMAADEERTRAAAMRVWGEHVRGCDTADAMADLIVRQREEIARLRGDLAQADAALRSVP